MTNSTLLILGDSTSMTVGMERESYPFHLAERPVWTAGTKIVNASLPGFTSTDGAAFYFGPGRRLANLRAVIIYLGNCDSYATEIRKAKFNRARDYITRTWLKFRGNDRSVRLKNRLVHFQWNDQFDPEIEQPVSAEDFAKNIGMIIEDCARRGIKVILVRPDANRDFPAGIGKGNFLFYHYLGYAPRLAGKLKISDRRFVAAMAAQEQGRRSEAASAYKEILAQPQEMAGNLEYQILAAHNYAICKAADGDYDEAETVLRLLLKERRARKEIILYNLAKICEARGDHEDAAAAMADAYEADTSMYRVRADYIKATEDLNIKHDSVHLIDIHDAMGTDNFVDHCHLLPDRQKELAGRIAAAIPAECRLGAEKATIINQLTNPEYGLGISLPFDTYFRVNAPMMEAAVREASDALLGQISAASNEIEQAQIVAAADKQIGEALSYIIRHPAFPTYRHALQAGMSAPSDIGRFPEFFIVRILTPVLQEIDADKKTKSDFHATDCGLRTAEELRLVLPESIRHLADRPFESPGPDKARDWRDAILDRISTDLARHLANGNQIDERLLTTIFWYFRETLRFGSHSRYSMRYDRVNLEMMAEGLALATILDKGLDDSAAARISALRRCLSETISVHESFSKMLYSGHNRPTHLAEYDACLSALSAKVPLS